MNEPLAERLSRELHRRGLDVSVHNYPSPADLTLDSPSCEPQVVPAHLAQELLGWIERQPATLTTDLVWQEIQELMGNR